MGDTDLSGAERRGGDKPVAGAADSQVQPDAGSRVPLRMTKESIEVICALLKQMRYDVAEPILSDMARQIDAYNKKEFLDGV